jgi:hypothetical protein
LAILRKPPENYQAKTLSGRHKASYQFGKIGNAVSARHEWVAENKKFSAARENCSKKEN